MTRLLAVLVATSALAQETAPPAVKPKLTVVPFAGLSAEVAPRLGLKAAGMLATEFKSSESFEVVEVKKTATDAYADALAEAKSAVDEAAGLRTKKKFRLAEAALQKALTGWRTAAGGVTDIGDVVDALALLSAIQFNTGRDDEGAKSLTAALTLAPSRELPLAKTSALFARVVAETRKAVKEAPTGALTVESVPSNAAVWVDGVALGATPLTVREVPPGQHFWRALLSNGEVVGGVVEVQSGKQASVRATPVSKDAESRLLVAVAQNRLEADALAAAKDYAKSADVELVVFGGISREGKGLALDSFMYLASSGELRRLQRATFDGELLSAGMEFFSLAGDVAKKGTQTGTAAKAPTPVSMTLVGTATKQADVKYGQAPGIEGASDPETPEAGKTEEPRKPLERRAPLKKK